MTQFSLARAPRVDNPSCETRTRLAARSGTEIILLPDQALAIRSTSRD
jgi:hypothetical protein